MAAQDTGNDGARRRWRWALPTGAAVLVAGVVVGTVVATPRDDDVPTADTGGKSRQDWTSPRFVVTADSWDAEPGDGAWFQIYDIADGGKQREVEAVAPPSPSAGAVTSIVAGPDSTFLVAAWQVQSCETSLYRFTLTDDGHAKDLTTVTRDSIPALAAGLAISQDGRRIAYATGPCGADPADSPPATAPIALGVLDTATGKHRTWTSSRPTVVGEIVWADDNRTLGYTTAEIIPASATVGTVRVHATDVENPDTDLLSGRVLFTQADLADTVTTAVMNADGRTGYGALREEDPPSTVLFTFGEGQDTHVTETIPEDPNAAVMMSFGHDSGPRYACLGGIDAFGRVDEQELADSSPDSGQCRAAYAAPD
uniref:Uncharacterized protein n=1 Tax=uncultured bacterium AR_456 TaxID=1630014 RepID=A0A0E3M277_9BACT|nr:hypothetical protein [uncultured bacterium AR_456]